jgi:hypothetical protein
MKALQKYVDDKNKYMSLFRGQRTEALYEINTANGRKRVAESIDCELSPENLSCDGELPRAEVNRRYRALTSAAQDLIKLDPSMAQYMYEFGE